MSLPSTRNVRRRIEHVRRREIRVCLMCGYLFAARVSELASRASPGDTNTTARGPKGSDVRYDTFKLGPLEEEVAVFTVYTAKRGGAKRLIGLPLNKEYEPWTRQVYEYFQECHADSVFPFTRQKIWQHARQAFEGLHYPIDKYKVTQREGDQVTKKTVPAHYRSFGTHALRHLRATELIEIYGFDGVDLSIYGGWTLSSMMGVGLSIQRYAHLQWRKYFPKLLKKR